MTKRLAIGNPFPSVTVPHLGGGTLTLGVGEGGQDWQMIVVYRGKHCPICHKYLASLESLLSKFAKAGVSVSIVSADPEAKAQAMVDELGLTLPVGYGMTTAQMQDLGIYISQPGKSTDPEWPFPEPAVLIVDAAGNLVMIDQSNVPFARPDLQALAAGLTFVRSNDYPLRGTYPD